MWLADQTVILSHNFTISNLITSNFYTAITTDLVDSDKSATYAYEPLKFGAVRSTLFSLAGTVCMRV